MMMMKGNILKAWIKRCRKMNNINKENLASSLSSSSSSSSSVDGCCWEWASSLLHDQENKDEVVCIPNDVPKGHLVVYVGEKQRRFVIKVKLLKHPLFSALLDEAREEYEFSADSRFYIPCNEDIVLAVVRCANAITPRRHPNPRMLSCCVFES